VYNSASAEATLTIVKFPDMFIVYLFLGGDKAMSDHITESRFNMWRCIFAVAHVDDDVSTAERILMHRIISDHPFSPEQKKTLLSDIEVRQDIIALFAQISDPSDRSLFFKKARDLVWADGDYGAQEQHIILELQRAHVLSSDFDAIAYEDSIELEDMLEDPQPQVFQDNDPPMNVGFIERIMNLLRR